MVWTTLFGLAFLFKDARWPQTEDRWETFITVILAATFLLVKSWGMLRRAGKIDGLAASIICTNLAFCVAYLVLTGQGLYPGEFRSIWWNRLIRWPVVVTALWGIFEVCTVPDYEDAADEQDWYESELTRLALDNQTLRKLLGSYEQRFLDMTEQEMLGLPDKEVVVHDSQPARDPNVQVGRPSSEN
jgi:hypothetical protein